MKLKSVLYVVAAVSALGFFFVINNIAKEYKNLRKEIKNQLVSKISVSAQSKQADNIDKKIEVKKEAVAEVSPMETVINKEGALKEIGGGLDKERIFAKLVPQFDSVAQGFSGFKVNNIGKASMAEMAGLRNGDVIKVVNGQKLTSPQRAIQVFRKARNQSQIDVDLLRKNRLVQLKYDIKN